jgi:uncharacterized membrane protein YgdD (TMEM256/DUF423 family)
MNKYSMAFASFFGATGVIFGAFGAHILKKHLAIEQLASFDTGVKYQLIHSVVLLVIALNADKFNTSTFKIISNLLIVGIVFFSFSIYLLATRDITGFNNISFLGPITPLGGTMLIAAWITLFVSAFKTK